MLYFQDDFFHFSYHILILQKLIINNIIKTTIMGFKKRTPFSVKQDSLSEEEITS